jgi:drug/metabolite transporter (DMT)-like permease
MSVAAVLALVGVAVVWGWTFVLVKEAVAGTPPLTFLAARFLLALALLAILAGRRMGRLRRADLIAGGTVGTALFAGYLLQTWGLRFTTASKSGLITGLYVVLVPVLGWLLWRRREPRAVWIGVACATVGLILLALAGGARVGRINLGDVMTLGCAVGFAAHILLVDRFVRSLDYLRLLVVQIGTVAVLSLLGTILLEREAVVLSATLVRSVLITGIAGTALALYIMNRVQASSTASYTAIVLTMEPTFAALFGFVLLGERFTAGQWVGAALILLGLLIPRLRRASQQEDHRHPRDGDHRAHRRPRADRHTPDRAFEEKGEDRGQGQQR